MNSYARIEPETAAQGPIFKSPLVVLVMIGLLVAVHVCLALGGEQWQIWALAVFAFIPARLTGDFSLPVSLGADIWTFVSYGFLHSGWGHLLFNCLWLLIFGTITARRLQSWRFIVLSLVCAVAGSAAMLVSYWGQPVIVIGASAAVTGMMGAAVPLMFGHRFAVQNPVVGASVFLQPLAPLDLFRNKRALGFIILSLVLSLLPALGSVNLNSFTGDEAVAWQAHIAGFVAGILCFYGLDRIGGLPSFRS